MNNNVIAFRGRTANRQTSRQRDLANDLLTMANYLTTIAGDTRWPLWAEGIARELRAMSRAV